MKKQIDTKEMGRKLVALRGNRSIKKVAKEVGISKSALGMYENGERIPRDNVKLKLAEYYKRSISYIFFNLVDHEP